MKLVNISTATELLSNGELVVLPTDTVYGIACDYANFDSVKKVYQIKGRSDAKPLIVLIANLNMLEKIVSEITDKHKVLMDIFWPGALTLIFNKSDRISDLISAGGKTIGVRMPANKTTLEIINALGRPIVATSVNKSGMPSLVDLNEISAQFPGIALVDGGKQLRGIESTVLDLTSDKPKLIRQGTFLKEDLEAVLGEEIFI